MYNLGNWIVVYDDVGINSASYREGVPLTTLNLLVGLPASGKSTAAKEYAFNTGAIVLSSDDLREELLGDVNDQENNADIFEELYKRAEQALYNDVDVVIDATNVSAKRRMAFVNRFRSKADMLVAHYFDVPLFACLERNERRSRVVPEHVIRNMRNNLQIPTHEEGWDEVVIHHFHSKGLFMHERDSIERIMYENDHDRIFEALEKHFASFYNIHNLPQDSKYHSLSVSRHTHYVLEYIVKNYTGAGKMEMMWTALLHDTGKYETKNFKRLEDGTLSRYANFIGHENVSAQHSVNVLNLLGYDDNFILNVAFLVQNHMRLLSIGDSAKGLNKLKNFVGEDVFEKLQFFREADTNAK